MDFVLFHGSFNSYNQLNEYWYPQLEEIGNNIIFPKFPVDSWEEVTKRGDNSQSEKQTPSTWLQVVKGFLPEMEKSRHLVFIGHSTGPLFILHVLQRFKLKVSSAVFVSPFINPLVKPAWQVKAVNKPFYKSDFDFKELRALCPKSYVLYGTNDPYVETENSLDFAGKMGSEIIPVENGGHLNTKETSEKIIEICKQLYTTLL